MVTEADQPARLLEGEVLSGNTERVSLDTCGTAGTAVFWMDDASRDSAARIDVEAPFDLCTDSAGAAAPLNTVLLTNGRHVLSVELTSVDGWTAQVDAEFFVSNSGAPRLLVSTQADRSQATDLSGQTLAGLVYIMLAPSTLTAITEVQFFIGGDRITTELWAPYDLAGGVADEGNVDGEALPFDTASLASGSHLVEALVCTGSVCDRTISATFNVP